MRRGYVPWLMRRPLKPALSLMLVALRPPEVWVSTTCRRLDRRYRLGREQHSLPSRCGRGHASGRYGRRSRLPALRTGRAQWMNVGALKIASSCYGGQWRGIRR